MRRERAKVGLAAGGGDALASNSGGERRTRLAFVLVEKTTRKNSQETVDRRGFIECMGAGAGWRPPATPRRKIRFRWRRLRRLAGGSILNAGEPTGEF